MTQSEASGGFYYLEDNLSPRTSLDSFSTNATAPDLPGPGRLIGRVYNSAGKVLESGLSSILSRSILSKEKQDRGQDPGIAPYRGPVQSLGSRTTLSSNATADNLIGPGRLLGLAYEKGGRVIEVRINRLADKLGYGPDGIVRRIDSRSTEIIDETLRKTGRRTDRLDDIATKRIDDELKKDLLRLLKYTRSNVQTNQIIALKHITELSISRSYIRRLLGELDVVNVVDSVRRNVRYFQSSETLLDASRKALVSVTEDSVITPTQQLIHMCNTNDENMERCNTMLSQLLNYLHSYEVSFLVLRRLNALIDEGISMNIWFDEWDGELDILAIPRALSVVMAGPSQLVDWASIDQLFLTWIFTWDHYRYRALNTSILVLAYKYAGKLPRTKDILIHFSKCPIESSGELRDTRALAYVNLWAVIENVANSADLTEFTPETLRNITEQYQTPPLSEMWDNLLSPARIVLRQVLLERLLPGPPRQRWREVERVIPRERIDYFHSRLKALLSSNDMQVRADAKHCMEIVRKLDHYFWETMSMDDRDLSKRLRLIEVMNPKMKNNTYFRHLFRHLCEDGEICIYDYGPDAGCRCVDKAYASSAPRTFLGLMWWDVMWADHKPNTVFYAHDYHYPILAGTDTSGKRHYVASAVEGDYWVVNICSVAEGSSTVTFRYDGFDEQYTSENFRVLVLRYHPSSYPRARIKAAQKGVDATGPLSWTNERLKMRWEVLTGDENPLHAYVEA